MKDNLMCIFCSIANHEIPSSIVYEDGSVIAFLDLAPDTKGHTIIIPKKHYDNFLTCNSDDLQKVMSVTQDLANKLTQRLNCAGMNVLSNINEVAGQSVFHFHVHLIPRYTDADKITTDKEKQNLEQVLNEIK